MALSQGGQVLKRYADKMRPILAGSYFYIWFVFYANLPYYIKLLLFSIFFFALSTTIMWPKLILSDLSQHGPQCKMLGDGGRLVVGLG